MPAVTSRKHRLPVVSLFTMFQSMSGLNSRNICGSALVAHSAEEMQKIVDVFADASKKFVLKITIKKNPTEEMQKIVDVFADASKKFVLKITIKKGRGVVSTKKLYKNPRGGYHG